MPRFLFAFLLTMLLSPPTPVTADPVSEGEIVIPPGQEELLTEILGRGATFPGGCTFAGGGVEHAVVKARYECADVEITLELFHPSRAQDAAIRTERFAVTLPSGPLPPGFSDALEAWIRSHESGFEWVRLEPPPSPRPEPPPAPPAAAPPLGEGPERTTAPLVWLTAGLMALIACSWGLWRFARWRRARRRERPGIARWRVLARDRWFWAAIAVLVLSTLLRCWIGVINRQQPDNHLEVAAMIHKSGWAAPPPSACFQCSHPKLYHYALAVANSVIPDRDMLVGNLLNAGAATLLLILFLVFARGGHWSPPVRFLGFAFISFNAGLVGISSVATNDLFCILFSSLAIFHLDRFLARDSNMHLAGAVVAVILAAASKATGWAIFVAAVAVLCLTTLASTTRRRRYAIATVVFVVGFSCIVPLMHPYRNNLAQRGTPFVNDAFHVDLMQEEIAREPTWPLHMFFTFRYFELLRVPYNHWGYPPYPLHRESLWSQVYGRTFFLRFDQPIWQNEDPRLLFLGRVSLVLGLLPFAAFLLGAGRLLRSIGRGVSARGLRWFAERHDWQHLVYVGVMLASLVALVVAYHRLPTIFSWMKAFYLFPALLSFFKLFLDGLEVLWRRWPRVVTVWMMVLVAVSTADIGWLIHDLSGAPPR